jgi:hypothetical protein
MKRLLFVASTACILFSSQVGDCYAAPGPYDGEWTGSATSTGGRCRSGTVKLTVAGKVVTGQATFGPDAPNINGTVREDGSFGATIGFQPLTGKFTRDAFEGTFKNSDCAWRILLKRTN